MFVLIFQNLLRRPLRNGLTLAGIAVASAVLICIVSFGEGYRNALQGELNRSGVQMMLVPMGCPYDAASRVMQNNALEHSLPASVLEQARRDPSVAVAAPILTAASPRADYRRTDMWVGLDESALPLKPWWKMRSGRAWFDGPGEVILGADAAALEMRLPGDKFYSPEMQREFRVAGVLARSGTSDDSVFFVPLATAQQMFSQTGRLTAVAIRLKDPALVRETGQRLQRIPGAQVVTMAEMMGTFVNLLGAVRTLVLAVAFIAIAVSALSVFNTLLAAVIERTNELAVMRAIGASRTQVCLLLLGESLLLTLIGATLGVALAFLGGPHIEALAKSWIPFAPGGSLLTISSGALLRCSLLAICVGVFAAIYPAWRAARLQPALATKPE
ncbi:MAG TPA: ABC transporter permease [Candidatus Acidoferrum sp.]|nr:ABC transporter permease [Candidatus Acidoferrum sp.]